MAATSAVVTTAELSRVTLHKRPDDELVAAHLIYHQFEEQTTAFSFSGFGVRADFGLNYRTSENFHVGTRMSYHLAPVSREENFTLEPRDDRSLTLSWLDFAFDFTFYY